MLEAGRNEYAKGLAALCSLKGLLSQIPRNPLRKRSNHAGDPRDISAVWMQSHSTACCSVQGTLPNSLGGIDDHSLQFRITSVPHYAVLPPARRKASHDVVPGKLLNEPITSNQSRRNSCCVES
jgi:hypothetical protein